MSETTRMLQPVRHAVTVRLGVEDAWRLFTLDMDRWWPLADVSVFEERARRIEIEPWEGGEIREIAADGATAHWARIDVWEPPARLVLAWKPNPDRSTPTEVEVRFTADGEQTRVELEHRGWERLRADADEARESYATGWPGVLGRFESLAEGVVRR